MDGARRIPISSDSYFLGWLEPSDTLFVEERRKKGEREREGFWTRMDRNGERIMNVIVHGT